jgi:hypothetical protein
MKPSRLPSVCEFIAGFEFLPLDDRETAMREMRDFFDGYEEGRDEVFQRSEGEPRVLGEASGETLAATMTEMGIRPGHTNRGRA